MDTIRILAAAVVVAGLAGVAASGGGKSENPRLSIPTITIGNPGNGDDDHGPGERYGGVGYVYAIGRYEVTAAQYAAFLNAVAADDRYRLYNTDMWEDERGCKIRREGEPGSYTYSVEPDWADRPVNFVGWGDAARFVNWLHNGQPVGAQDLTTTEDGSYFLNGQTANRHLEDIAREPDATWVIPSEDEWYKAAYHKNDGVTGNYWNYPTQADLGVSNELVDPDPGNNATFHRHPTDTLGPPYYRSEVGAHENTTSAYGAFDMGGNVQEWNESVPLSDGRGLRGGSYFWGSVLLSSRERLIEYHSSDEFEDIGFRVARVRYVFDRRR